MAEYIERQKLLDSIIHRLGIKSEKWLLPAERVLYDEVENAPTADVVERKKGEWISIESKLPPEGEECLIYDGDAIYVWELRRDWQTNELVFEDKYGYDQDMEEVEYWMPLPEPPKEET